MSITPQHTQELLHRAYILAVAADAGLNISIGNQLDYGVDAEVNRVLRVVDATGETVMFDEPSALRIQLKATTLCRSYANHIHYSCEARAFNKMVIHNQRGVLPCILVVFCQPKERSDWLTISDDALTLRTACYWYYLTGPQTTKTAETIRIPRTQLFDAAALEGIMKRIESGAKP